MEQEGGEGQKTTRQPPTDDEFILHDGTKYTISPALDQWDYVRRRWSSSPRRWHLITASQTRLQWGVARCQAGIRLRARKLALAGRQNSVGKEQELGCGLVRPAQSWPVRTCEQPSALIHAAARNPFGGRSHREIFRCFDRWMRCCACRKAPTFAPWIAVILLAAGGSVALAPSAARAAPVLFGVQGVFEDGGTFSGTFLFDPLQPPSPPPGPPTAFIDAFSLTSTPGPVFPGFAYSGTSANSDAQVAPLRVIQFSFVNVQQGSVVSQLVISTSGDSFAGFSGGPIVPLVASYASVISFEQGWSFTEFRYRAVAGGLISVVPEPVSIVLVLMGVVGIGLSRSSR